jgi:hypothetical protein
MEGVSNILLLGFQPTITHKEKEITNKCRFFLTNSKKERDQTLVHQANYHPIEKNKSPRGLHHLISSIHQEITPKFICKRDKHKKSSSIVKISAKYFSQWESYDMK